MAKFHVSNVKVQEGQLYERYAEDGPIYCYDLVVYAYVDGDVYMHNHVFKGAIQDEYEGYYHPNYNAKNDAHRLADRVRAFGIIDTDHWEFVGNLSELKLTEEERIEEMWSNYADAAEGWY